MTTPPYFHELDEEAQQSALEWCRTREQFLEVFQQPDWCGYPKKLGKWGCYSLMIGRVTGESFCADCELFTAHPQSEYEKANR